jgi:hypothetical protein
MGRGDSPCAELPRPVNCECLSGAQAKAGVKPGLRCDLEDYNLDHHQAAANPEVFPPSARPPSACHPSSAVAGALAAEHYAVPAADSLADEDSPWVGELDAVEVEHLAAPGAADDSVEAPVAP